MLSCCSILAFWLFCLSCLFYATNKKRMQQLYKPHKNAGCRGGDVEKLFNGISPEQIQASEFFEFVKFCYRIYSSFQSLSSL